MSADDDDDDIFSSAAAFFLFVSFLALRLLPRIQEVTHDDSIISHPITTMKIGELHI